VEVLAFIAAFLALAVAAELFGADSRPLDKPRTR